MTDAPRLGPTFETERLLIRPFEDDDFDGYAAMLADPEVVRYLGHPPMDRADAWRNLAMIVGHEHLRGWSNNAVIDRGTGAFLGRCGLYQPEGWPGLEVGWCFRREAWGKGYATEAATVWRDWAFTALGADDLISVVHVDNVASQRLAERIGHRRRHEQEIRGHPCVIYGQTRQDWSRATGVRNRRPSDGS